MPVDVGLISPMGLAGEAANYARMFPDFAAQELQRQQLAIQGAQEQRLTADAQGKAQRAAQYQAELVELNKNPTADNVAAFMMRWPELSQEMGAAHKMSQDAQSKRKLEQAGQVVFAMQNKNFPLALQKLKERQAADAAAGREPDTIADAAIADLESGDPERVKRAETTVNVIMAGAMGNKEYHTALTGGEPSDFDKKVASLNKLKPGLGMEYAETTAKGAMQPYYEGENLVGAVRVGSLPEVTVGGQPAAPAAPAAPPQQQGVPFKTDDGSISGMMVKDASGRPLVTSPQFSRPVRYVVTQQDYDLVQPGETYIDSYSGDPQTKPGK